MHASPLVPLRAALLVGVTLVALLAGTTAAQTGPWQDGELLIIATPPAGPTSLRRIVPETGASADVIANFTLSGTADSIAFDRARDGVLANLSLPPDLAQNYKLWLIGSDGSAVALPGYSFTQMRALCPLDDGRVYFQRATAGGNTIEYYDGGNQLHTLQDAGGQAPLVLPVEHMLYDPIGNALIATTSVVSGAAMCSPSLNSVYRIPLSQDGSQLSGAVSCTSWLGQNEIPCGLAALPSGDVLMTLGSLTSPFITGRLARIDPSGPGVSAWADPTATNLRGGVYSARLARAVVFDDFAAKLLTYTAGSAGAGAELAVDVPFDTGTGFPNAMSRILELEVLGQGCDGFSNSYGSGLAGLGGFVPSLVTTGCPDVDALFSLVIDDVRGQAAGLLFAGLSSLALPFKGGTFLVGTLALQLPISVGGMAGAAGDGALAVPVLFTDPLLIGLDLYVQAGFADVGGVSGVSLTNGSRIHLG